MSGPSSQSTSPRRTGPDLRLRPTERVQRPSEFQRVLKGGRCFRDPIARIHFLENRREMSRLGLVVSGKIGGAVVRNRIKRILRQLFREAKSRFAVPLDVVVVPDRRAGPQDRAAYARLFERFAAYRSGGPRAPRGGAEESGARSAEKSPKGSLR
jgi:ribonuclease P protein component